MAETIVLILALAANLYFLRKLKRAGQKITRQEFEIKQLDSVNRYWQAEAKRFEGEHAELFVKYCQNFETNAHLHNYDTGFKIDPLNGQFRAYCECGASKLIPGRVHAA